MINFLCLLGIASVAVFFVGLGVAFDATFFTCLAIAWCCSMAWINREYETLNKIIEEDLDRIDDKYLDRGFGLK